MFDFDWYKNEGVKENLNRFKKKIFDLILIYTFIGIVNGLNEILVIGFLVWNNFLLLIFYVNGGSVVNKIFKFLCIIKIYFSNF